MIKVRAKSMGFYGLRRRREGEEFEISEDTKVSKHWMERLDGPSSVEVEEVAAPTVAFKKSKQSSAKSTGDADVI